MIKKIKKKARFVGIMAIIASLLLSACSSGGSEQSSGQNAEGDSNQEAQETYKVGLTNWYSGKMAAMGKIVQAAVNIALEEHNSTAEVPIELISEDVGETPVTTKNAYEKLLEKNPPAIVGFMSSPNFYGVSPLLEEAQVPFIHVMSLGTIFEHGWDWIFGLQIPNSLEAPLAIKYYHEKLGKNRIAVMVANDDTGKAIAESVEAFAANADGLEIITEFFNPGENDYSPTITAVRRQNPDMYYVNTAITADLGRIITQMKSLGIEEPISAGFYVANADFLALLSPIEAEGLYGHSAAYVDWEDPRIKEFSEKFNERTGLQADPVSLLCYDAALVLFKAVDKAGGDREKTLEALRETKYEGLSGYIEFDSKGRGRTDTSMLQIGPEKSIIYLENYKYTEE